jgi:hypothetical protein
MQTKILWYLGTKIPIYHDTSKSALKICNRTLSSGPFHLSVHERNPKEPRWAIVSLRATTSTSKPGLLSAATLPSFLIVKNQNNVLCFESTSECPLKRLV